MGIEQLRGILVELLLVASDDIRRARADEDHWGAGYIEIERDTIARIILIIDSVFCEP